MEILNSEDVRKLLRLAIDRAGDQSKWSRQAGVNRAQINRVLNGRRLPPSQICQALGLEWAIVRHFAGKDGRPRTIVVENREFLSILKSEIEKLGSLTAWCEQTGVNRTYLSQVVNKRRAAGAKILRALNLSEVLVRATQSRAVSKRGRKYLPPGKRHPHARWTTA
jgi:DNA-binding transcriptional regulator YdaS (Cro superfamily)